MRVSSLAVRLFLSAAIWTVIVLIVTGLALSSLYRQSVERSFDRRLNFYLRTLVTELPPTEENADKLAQSLGEPLFDLPLSGWYWQVVRLDGGPHPNRASRSLWDRTLPRLFDSDIPLTKEGVRIGYAAGPEDQALRMVERPVDSGPDGSYLVAVAGDASEIAEEIWTFDVYLIVTFAILTAVLLVSTIFQVRFGLSPLKRISQSLSDIRSGRAEKLEGTFPVEIEPLARETNALLDANREIVERSRMHVGNLAHALKTPLSVIVNEANAHADGDGAFSKKLLEQAAIMRDQVAWHLDRARIAARAGIVGTVTEVAPVVQALCRTMEKLHRERNLSISADIPVEARFQGERQDLEEMIGNLVDNACKWCDFQVRIEVLRETGPAGEPQIRIIVDDDGHGIAPAERNEVAKRGRRLDETKSGSGLGLSIVVELATLYRGRLTLGTAPIGGVRAELFLPGAAGD